MITQEQLVGLLTYDAASGIFYWRHAAGRYGRIPAGSIAGTVDQKGYRIIVLKGKNYKAHRLAWLYVHGHMPDQIDHENRIKTDNRISNLREATSEQNSGNIGLRSDNTSGFRGVSWNARKAKYQARLHRKSLGYFDSAEQAAIAASEYRRSKYGEFAA